MAPKSFREIVEGLKRTELRGSIKLRAALDAFAISVEGRTCLDVGASTGGFTTVLLERGAAKVYAVDVGHGQLLGSLRQDRRVVNMEHTNISAAEIDARLDLATVDVSYLSLASAAGWLNRFGWNPGAEFVGLVKPMFELKLATAPTDEATLERAVAHVVDGVSSAGWTVVSTMVSPARGAKGAIEGFVHAKRRTA